MALRACRWLGVILAATLAGAAEGEGEDQLLASTLALRSALHQDATLAAPLERLVAAWREADRLPELIAVYREHLDGWPDDVPATVVWLRLLQAAGDPAALTAVREAVGRLPADPYLHYLAWLALRDARDRSAIDELEKAASLEPLAWRRRQWSDELVKEAVVQGRREVAARHLLERAASEERADALFETGRAMASAGLHAEALKTLLTAAGRDPDPETLVAIELEATAAEAALGRRDAAATRLDALAARLGPEHWRRPEVARRRLALAADEAEREKLLIQARERLAKSDSDEAAVLDAARLLAGAGHRAEALAGLRGALPRLGGAPRIEREIDELFDRTRDEPGRAAWLAERLAADPARTDLAWRRAGSLYRSGQASAGDAVVDALAARLPAAERADACATLGRGLRKAAVLDGAAAAFQRALTADPARLGLRRELGECLLALGQRRQVRELMAAPEAVASARTVPVEILLEVLPFCQRQNLYAEATALADARLAADPEQFDVLLAAAHLAHVARARDVAARRRMEARALADTPARYRAWLDGMFEGDLDADGVAALIDAETGRIAAPESDRLAALAEIARTRNQAERARALLERALISAPPAQIPALHRAMVACLCQLPERAGELAAVLQQMAQDEPESRDEALLRLAMLGGNDGGELPEPDLAQIHDAELLSAWYERLRAQGDAGAAVAVAARLVEVEGSSPDRWRTYLALLAVTGDEAGFRTSVRRLLAGVDRLRPSGAMRSLLARHLADSAWRQTVRALAGSDAAAVDAALEAIAEVESGDPTPGEHAWLLWARAMLAARSGRISLGSESRAALVKAAHTLGDRLELPDGVTIALAEIEASFAAQPPPPTAAVALRPWQARWAVRHPGQVTALARAGAMVVALDASGSLSAYEPAGGRLRWRLPNAASVDTTDVGYGMRRPVLLAAGSGIVTISSGSLTCREGADGRTRWQASVGTRVDAAAVDRDQILAVEASAGRVVAIDLASGRRRWEWVPELPVREQLTPLAAIDGSRVLLYGRRTALLDAATRTVRWSVDPLRVRPVDVRLDGSESPPATLIASPHRHGGAGVPVASVVDAVAQFPSALGDHRLVAPLAVTLLQSGRLYGVQLVGELAVVASDMGIIDIPLTLPGLAVPDRAGHGWLLGQVDGWAVSACQGGARIDRQGQGSMIAAAAALRAESAGDETATPDGNYGGCFTALDGQVLYACTADGIAAFAMPSGERLMLAPFPPQLAGVVRPNDQPHQLEAFLAGGPDQLVVAFGSTLVGLAAPAPDAGHAFP